MATRTFTHLYDSYEDAQRTVEALQAAGIPHADISIVSNDADGAHATDRTVGGTAARPDAAVAGTATGTGATTGTLVGGSIGLLTGLGMLAIPGVGPVVAAGWLVATLAGAGLGAAGGGLLGSLVHAGVPEEQAHTYAEDVRRGGTLVTVRGDDSQATSIAMVFEGRSTSAVDVTDRRTEYKSGGWTGYEDTAAPYTAEQVDAERSRRVRVLKTD